MHPRINREFERICSRLNISGRVLEVGATPGKSTLLCLPSVRNADERIGLNLAGPATFDGFEIIEGNANERPFFEDSSFDAVLSNAMLEHDPFFWKSLEEMRRVTKPGGALVIGVPGYARLPGERVLHAIASRIPFCYRYLNVLTSGTLTLGVHQAPGDYYRFSPQALKEVFLAHMEDAEVTSLLFPPRFIGSARKPGRDSPRPRGGGDPAHRWC